MEVDSTGNVLLNHDLTVTADSVFNSNVTLGDASTDGVTIHSSFIFKYQWNIMDIKGR